MDVASSAMVVVNAWVMRSVYCSGCVSRRASSSGPRVLQASVGAADVYSEGMVDWSSGVGRDSGRKVGGWVCIIVQRQDVREGKAVVEAVRKDRARRGSVVDVDGRMVGVCVLLWVPLVGLFGMP